MKVLVIYSHAYPETSKAGNAILEVFQATPGFEVRNLDALYPDLGKIDVVAEQQALLEADVIIFQHPIFFCGVPAALKRWMEVALPTGRMEISSMARSSSTPSPRALGLIPTQESLAEHSVPPLRPLRSTVGWSTSEPSPSMDSLR